MRGRIATILVCALACVAPRALAATPKDAQVQAARELFVAAEQDEDAKRWGDALEKMRRVAQVRLTAGVRYHVALCEENVGELLAALSDYTLAENQAKRENAQDVAALVGPRLAKLNGRVPRLTLHVEAGPSDLEVHLDGGVILKAMWGVAIPVDPGEHKIEAMAGGYVPFARTVPMAERDNTLVEVAVTVRAVAAPPAPESSPAILPPTSPPTLPRAAAPSSTPASPTDAVESPSHTGAILATVGAAVFLGGGIASYFVAGNTHDSAVTTCATRATSCDDLKHGVQLWDTLALSSWIASAALTTVAIIAWAAPHHDSAPSASSATLILGPGSLGLRGTF
jgi:hypothetical protein